VYVASTAFSAEAEQLDNHMLRPYVKVGSTKTSKSWRTSGSGRSFKGNDENKRPHFDRAFEVITLACCENESWTEKLKPR